MSAPDPAESSRHFRVVAAAIAFIRRHARRQPTLDEIAAAVNLSPYHLQRLFAEWAGISPKRFLQYLTKEYARQQLAKSADVLSVALDAGLSSTSRLHDLMVSCEAMTPGEIKSGGSGMEITYGVGASPFGEAILAWTARGICHFAFCTDAPPNMAAELRKRWPGAVFSEDERQAETRLQQIFTATPERGKIHLLLRGTNFQIKVWEALIQTEFGQLTSYRQLAQRACVPTAQRAVGSALAANSIAFLIPCHRVIREGGEPGDYRWGLDRKLAMQGWEAAFAPD